MRNMFKILFCSTPCQTLPPWTLFSWHLYDFGNRMQTDNQLYMRSFLDLPERTQNLAKLKFEVKMLTDTMEHILHDILHVGNFTDSLNLIRYVKTNNWYHHNWSPDSLVCLVSYRQCDVSTERLFLLFRKSGRITTTRFSFCNSSSP